jgi:hypothetical protein
VRRYFADGTRETTAIRSNEHPGWPSFLANTGFSESFDDVVVLTTKLRIARTCVADLLKPSDREVRSDCLQFDQHLLGHFQLASGSISLNQIYIRKPVQFTQVDGALTFLDAFRVLAQMDMSMTEEVVPSASGRIFGA